MVHLREEGSSVETTDGECGMATRTPEYPQSNAQFARDWERANALGSHYYDRLPADLLSKHRGEIVIINVETGERVFGRTEVEASDKFVAEFGQAVGFCREVE